MMPLSVCLSVNQSLRSLFMCFLLTQTSTEFQLFLSRIIQQAYSPIISKQNLTFDNHHVTAKFYPNTTYGLANNSARLSYK